MTLESLSPSESSRIPEVDGLRGIAILMVLLWHCIVAPSVTAPTTVASYAMAGLSFTWSGVDLFFVLSGFLIGGILLDQKTSHRYYQTFYVRRFFRIVPVYVIACITFWIIAMTLSAEGDGYSQLFASSPPPLALLTFTQNFWMGTIGGLGAYAFAPMWSLAVEEQFYLTLPFIVRSLDRRRLLRLLLAVLMLAPVLRIFLLAFAPHGWVWAFTAMPARADALAIGILVALAMRSPAAVAYLKSEWRKLVIIPVAAGALVASLVASRLVYNDIPMAAVGYSALAIVYGTLLIAALLYRGGAFGRILRSAPLRWVGSVAYGTYLFHMVVLYVVFALARNGSAPRIDSPGDVGVAILAIAISLGIARVSWTHLERHFVRFGRDYRYHSQGHVTALNT